MALRNRLYFNIDDFIGIGLLLEEAKTMTSIVGYHENILSLKGLIIEADGKYVSEVFHEAHMIFIAYNQWLCVHINIHKHKFLQIDKFKAFVHHSCRSCWSIAQLVIFARI